LEPNVIGVVRTGAYRNFSQEDASNNVAYGYYTIGKELIDVSSIRFDVSLITVLVSRQGFLVFYSFNRGTGSGIGALLMGFFPLITTRRANPSCRLPRPKTTLWLNGMLKLGIGLETGDSRVEFRLKII
jgi:hypothetical protein